ncbi:MAG: redoxin domain-containing protein [Thermoguttaceae bacterium]|jgi:thiol-disulfide isomerase/thioredoxin|nr:redoxin domain-containing protein [Thermoguttaceae bacterium]
MPGVEESAGRRARWLLAIALWCGVGLALAAAPPVSQEPPVRLIDEKDLDKVLKSHQGKVVLVDFWATWCESCVENFPHTVKLHHDLANKGLAVLGVSMDEPEDAPQVRKFLASKKAAFENFQSRLGGSSDESMARFQIRNGTLPHLRLYDRAGKLRKVFPPEGGKKLDPKAIEREVRSLLAEPP